MKPELEIKGTKVPFEPPSKEIEKILDWYSVEYDITCGICNNYYSTCSHKESWFESRGLAEKAYALGRNSITVIAAKDELIIELINSFELIKRAEKAEAELKKASESIQQMQAYQNELTSQKEKAEKQGYERGLKANLPECDKFFRDEMEELKKECNGFAESTWCIEHNKPRLFCANCKEFPVIEKLIQTEKERDEVLVKLKEKQSQSSFCIGLKGHDEKREEYQKRIAELEDALRGYLDDEPKSDGDIDDSKIAQEYLYALITFLTKKREKAKKVLEGEEGK